MGQPRLEVKEARPAGVGGLVAALEGRGHHWAARGGILHCEQVVGGWKRFFGVNIGPEGYNSTETARTRNLEKLKKKYQQVQ